MTKIPILAVISLLTGAIWRAELETRWGWASMDWIGPFHWAFPVAAMMFLAWVRYELRDAPPRARQVVLCVIVVLGLVAYYIGGIAMAWAYSRWIGLFPRWHLYRTSPVLIYAVLGAVYFTTVAMLVSPRPMGTAAGVACYALAFPFALLLLWLTDHRGGPDPIHAIKSGFVFPFITWGLGLPITMRRERTRAR